MIRIPVSPPPVRVGARWRTEISDCVSVREILKIEWAPAGVFAWVITYRHWIVADLPRPGVEYTETYPFFMACLRDFKYVLQSRQG